MVAGMPGTGIGGVFYLLIALWMPIRELYLKVRKQSSPDRWRIVRRHMCITGWLIVGTWTTGELIGWLLLKLKIIHAQSTHNILHLSPFLLTLATLIFIYLVVQVIRFCISNADKKARNVTS